MFISLLFIYSFIYLSIFFLDYFLYFFIYSFISVFIVSYLYILLLYIHLLIYFYYYEHEKCKPVSLCVCKLSLLHVCKFDWTIHYILYYSLKLRTIKDKAVHCTWRRRLRTSSKTFTILAAAWWSCWWYGNFAVKTKANAKNLAKGRMNVNLCVCGVVF